MRVTLQVQGPRQAPSGERSGSRLRALQLSCRVRASSFLRDSLRWILEADTGIYGQ